MKNIPRPLFSPTFLTILLAAILRLSIFLAATPRDPVVARMVSDERDVEDSIAAARFNDTNCGCEAKNI